MNCKNRCYNGGKQHKFKPRYDEKPFDELKNFEGNTTASGLRSILFYDVYVCDICVWCGKKTNR